MKRAYLLAFSDGFGTLDDVKRALNAMPVIEKWRYDMSNAFYLVSASTASEIATQLRAKIQTGGRFIVTEVGPNKGGWLTRQSWHLMNTLEYLSE